MSELARLSGLGPKRLAALEKSGIFHLRDLVYHLPRSYADRTRFQSLSEIQPGQEAYFLADVQGIAAFGNRMIVSVGDDASKLDLVFFQGLPYLKGKFRTGQKLVIAGAVTFFRGLQIAHPEWEIIEGDILPQPPGLLPRYPLTEAMSEARIEHKRLQGWALETLKSFAFSDPLSAELRREAGLGDETSLLRRLHAPATLDEAREGMQAVKLRELLPLFQTMEKRRRARSDLGTAFPPALDLQARFLAGLPFALTGGQAETATAIRDGLNSRAQFTGLLQGDVGSGKTVVAALASLGVLSAGSQVALMAPTEILAQQHMRTLSPWFSALGFSPALLTGEVQGELRADIFARLQSGELKMVIGTHALLGEGVAFQNLGLAIIDEQHRFGVKQREALAVKGTHPHILYLSATPIPRTLAQTVYGDLELFILTEKPPGRLPVKTRLVQESKRSEMLRFLVTESNKGNQVFWVMPRIGQSPVGEEQNAKKISAGETDKAEARGIEAVLNELGRFSSEWVVAAIHGRMPAETRAKTLARFRAGEIQALVATTVIEVGVDIPQANLMVIENPDSFGLAQLHQLRGRTGRGQEQAWCFLLMPSQTQPDTEVRLRTFASTEDGFRLAEIDLKSRGAGHLDGTVQSGFGALRFADLVADADLVDVARGLARRILV